MLYTAQEVAAAILYLYGSEMEYNMLTRQVRATNLNGLGSQGGETHPRTLNTDLNRYYGSKSNGQEIFDSIHVGHYKLYEPESVKDLPRIADAIEQVRYIRLTNRIKKLKKRLEDLSNMSESIDRKELQKQNNHLEKGIHDMHITIKEGMGEYPGTQDQAEFRHRHTKI